MKKALIIIGYVTIFLVIILGVVLERIMPKEWLYNLGFTIGCFVMAGFDLIREVKRK